LGSFIFCVIFFSLVITRPCYWSIVFPEPFEREREIVLGKLFFEIVLGRLFVEIIRDIPSVSTILPYISLTLAAIVHGFDDGCKWRESL
jgi:hypothetical protein